VVAANAANVVLDAVRAMRVNLDGPLSTFVLLALWGAASGSCFIATRAWFDHRVGITASTVTATVLLAAFCVSVWVRFAIYGLGRTLAGWLVVAVGALWLLFVTAHFGSPLAAAAVVGCELLATLVLTTAIEAIRTGSTTGHALYIFRTINKRCLYVGRTNNPRRRWNEHQGDKDWYPQVAIREVFHYPSLAALIEAERKAIKRERPVYNVVHNLDNRRRRVA
jgi:predicted GIY-YIG superfamily endonuclease